MERNVSSGASVIAGDSWQSEHSTSGQFLRTLLDHHHALMLLSQYHTGSLLSPWQGQAGIVHTRTEGAPLLLKHCNLNTPACCHILYRHLIVFEIVVSVEVCIRVTVVTLYIGISPSFDRGHRGCRLLARNMFN